MKGYKRQPDGSWLSDSFPRIRAYYDRSAGVRSWIVTAEDAEGIQLGDAAYCATQGEVPLVASDVFDAAVPLVKKSCLPTPGRQS